MRKKRSGVLAAIALILLILAVRLGIEMVNTRRNDARIDYAEVRAADSAGRVCLDSIASAPDTTAKAPAKKRSKKNTGRQNERKTTRPVARDYLGDSIPSNR